MTTTMNWFNDLNDCLKQSQRDIRDFIISTPRCGVFVGMGSGKTMTTLAALATVAEPGHILIIAPKNIADNTWPEEVEKWNIPINTKSLHVTEPGFYKNGKPKKSRVLKKAEREELYAGIADAPPTMYFTTLQNVVDIVEWFSTKGHTRKTPDYSNWPFATMILDESQSFKDGSTKRYKALRNIAAHARRVILLSGTPAAESLENLWSQLYLLDGGARLGQSLTKFRQRWFYPGRSIPGVGVVEWVPLQGSEEEIFRTISDVALHRKNHDLKLPGVEFIDHQPELSAEEKQAYNQLSRKATLDILVNQEIPLEELSESDIVSIIGKNAAVLNNKLLQFAAGVIRLPIEKDDPNYAQATKYTSQPVIRIHNHKIDTVTNIARQQLETEGSPVLIAYQYIAERELLLASLRNAGIEACAFDGTNTMFTAWNDRRIPAMLIHPKSAGHGLNLQHGGHTMIWSTLPLSGEQYDQTNARLNRLGQDHVVTIHRVMTKGTIDTKTPGVLARKGSLQDSLLNALDSELNYSEILNEARNTAYTPTIH